MRAGILLVLLVLGFGAVYGMIRFLRNNSVLDVFTIVFVSTCLILLGSLFFAILGVSRGEAL
jgi:hypothetical protein